MIIGKASEPQSTSRKLPLARSEGLVGVLDEPAGCQTCCEVDGQLRKQARMVNA